VVAAVEADLAGLMSRGHLGLLAAEYYKPGWDMAVKWAGRTPVAVPEPETSPADAYKRLWEALRGRGVPKASDEEHAWKVPDAMVMELGQLLAGAARYAGQLKLQPLRDGHVRLSLDSGRRWPAQTPDEIRGLAFSLSHQQEAALGELREAGSRGASSTELMADPRTVKPHQPRLGRGHPRRD
jgi:hypothetical protein